MTDRTHTRMPRVPSKSDTEAVEWLIRFTEIAANSADPAAERRKIQDEFNEWATQSPANLRSFLETALLFEALGDCEAEIIPELLGRIDSHENLSAVIPGWKRLTVVDSSVRAAAANKRIERRWPQLALAAVAVGVTISAALLLGHATGVKTYQTTVSQRARIQLQDGSVVFLNEQSELRLSNAHDIRMVRGEALFEVTHDPLRVWTVHSGNADIKVLGTQFDVYQRSGPTRVAVVEGAVQVNIAPQAAEPPMSAAGGEVSAAPQDSSNSQREVKAGQVVQANDREVTPISNVGVSDIVDWHHAELLVDRWPLATVVEKFNLDNVRQLQIADTAVGQLPIRGRFKTDHPERFVETLRHLYPGVPMRETDTGWVLGTQGAAR